MFGRPLRDVFIWCVFVGAGAYSLYRELQVSFVACSAICIGIVWKHHSLQLLDLVKAQLSRVTQAKFAGVSLTSDPMVLRAMAALQETQPWMAVLIEGLTASHLSLLALVNESGTHLPSGDQQNQFRELRSRGLVTSDGAICDGGVITATPLGQQVFENLKSYAPSNIENA